MKDDRYKQLMLDLGMPDSQSLLGALQQVANEVEQEVRKELAVEYSKIPITFTCYKYNWTEYTGTMFLFYPDGEWDEDKLTIADALVNYPIDTYEWIHIGD